MGSNWRELAIRSRGGAIAGALLAIPITISLLTHKGPYGNGPTSENLLQFLMMVPSPGTFFAFGKWPLAFPINSLIWAATWVVWRSRSNPGSVTAKAITLGCWGVWMLAAWVYSTSSD